MTSMYMLLVASMRPFAGLRDQCLAKKFPFADCKVFWINTNGYYYTVYRKTAVWGGYFLLNSTKSAIIRYCISSLGSSIKGKERKD